MKIKVENKTLVITDPCYVKRFCSHQSLIEESTIYGDWTCMCYKCDNKENVERKIKEWNDYYFDFFRRYNFSGLTEEEKKELNNKFEEHKKEFIEKNCYGEFCADSGNVAVYEADSLNEDFMNWAKEHPWCVCFVPNYTGDVEYVVEIDVDNRSAHIVGDNFYTTQSGF